MSPSGRVPLAARRILAGDRATLARVISDVENRAPSAIPVLRALYAHTGRARVIGFTGPLGVGKSSLISALLGRLRAAGRRVGIVAVDPSSPFSGGAVLGDRIRIERRAGDDGVFFRSMGSRGHAGGVAAATREVVRLLDAFGMDVVLLETVGSGQVDVEVRTVATTNVVVLVPHLGDEVQTLKAGLFEIADVFCVNKGDLPGADLARKDLVELTALTPARGAWRPRVVTASAKEATGIDELWEAIEAHEAFLDADGRRTAGERERIAGELIELVRERVEGELTVALRSDRNLQALVDRVASRALDPHAAADRLYRGRRPRRPPAR